MVQPFRSSNQTQVDFIFPEELEGVVGGLTFDGHPDMGVGNGKFLQVIQKHIFAECGGNADSQMSYAKLIDLF